MARVLVVDDHRSIRMLVVMALDYRGHECDEAGTGAEAIEMVKAKQYDALILDLMMPEVDGMAVLRALPHDDNSARPHVVVLTASAEPEAGAAALAAGAEIVIVKPFDPDAVAAEVEALLR